MTNAEKIRKKIQEFIATAVHDNILNLLERLADRIILESLSVPVDTGNLQDSTGIGIYHGDCLFRLVPNPIAEVPNPMWGHEALQKALDYGAMKFSNDYWLVIFSAMPYAAVVDTRTGYFKGIKSETKNLALRLIKEFKRI